MARELRPYQSEASEAVDEEWAEGNTRTAIVLPTGCGKTDVIADKATRNATEGRYPLILAHRDELLNQIQERCGMHAPGLRSGRIQAKVDQRGYPITVAMTPTLARPARRERLARAYESMRPDRIGRPGIVIMDECHHATSPSVMDILEWAGCFDPVDPTPTMGVTATLIRGDKRSLGDVWQSVAFSRDIAWAIGEGWLVPVRGKVVIADHVDLHKAKIRKGDYTERELGAMVAQDVDQIVKAWEEHAATPEGGHRTTVAFVPSVEACHAMAEAFTLHGYRAGVVLGDTPASERAVIYRDLEAGRLDVMVNVMVATEGWDCPPVSCVLMARPTRLPGLYTQIVGRGLRPSPSTGKTDCLVLDVVGASRGQKLTTLIDLAPTAEIDSSALDDLPCEDCGGYSLASLRRLGLTEGVDAKRCTCGLGGPAIQPPKLIGPASYEDYDLLATDDPRAVWLRTSRGVPFVVPGNDRIGVLWPEGGDLSSATTWTAGHIALTGPMDAVTLGEGLPLSEAHEVTEAWALAASPWSAQRNRGTHRQPTPGQCRKARGLGIVAPETYSQAALSEKIDILLANSRLH